MRRSKLQEVSSDHVWARIQIKGFLTTIKKSWPHKEIKLSSIVLEDIEWALENLEQSVKDSYSNYKEEIMRRRKNGSNSSRKSK